MAINNENLIGGLLNIRKSLPCKQRADCVVRPDWPVKTVLSLSSSLGVALGVRGNRAIESAVIEGVAAAVLLDEDGENREIKNDVSFRTLGSLGSGVFDCCCS